MFYNENGYNKLNISYLARSKLSLQLNLGVTRGWGKKQHVQKMPLAS